MTQRSSETTRNRPEQARAVLDRSRMEGLGSGLGFAHTPLTCQTVADLLGARVWPHVLGERLGS